MLKRNQIKPKRPVQLKFGKKMKGNSKLYSKCLWVNIHHSLLNWRQRISIISVRATDKLEDGHPSRMTMRPQERATAGCDREG